MSALCQSCVSIAGRGGVAIDLGRAVCDAQTMKTHLLRNIISFLFALFSLSAFSPSIGLCQSAARVKVAELQFSVCESDPLRVLKALDAKSIEKSERSVFYLETGDRILQQHAAVMRYRVSGREISSAAKRSFQSNRELPPDQFEKLDAECEVDGYLSRAKIGCKVKSNSQKLGEMSEDQRSFFKDAGIKVAFLKTAVLWGPVLDQEWEFTASGFDFSLGAYSQIQGGRQFASTSIMELSARVPVADALPAQQAMFAVIQRAGLHLCEEQVGVTQKILDLLIPAPHDPGK